MPNNVDLDGCHDVGGVYSDDYAIIYGDPVVDVGEVRGDDEDDVDDKVDVFMMLGNLSIKSKELLMSGSWRLNHFLFPPFTKATINTLITILTILMRRRMMILIIIILVAAKMVFNSPFNLYFSSGCPQTL